MSIDSNVILLFVNLSFFLSFSFLEDISFLATL